MIRYGVFLLTSTKAKSRYKGKPMMRAYASRSRNEKKNCNSPKQVQAYNSIFSNLFSYTQRQSVTDLQHTLARPTWEELVEKRKSNFTRKSNLLPAVSPMPAYFLNSPV